MPDKSARPFLPLAVGPNNQLRQKVRGGGAKPRESAAQHGRNLIQQVEAFQKVIDQQSSSRGTDLPPLPEDVQVIIEAPRLLPEQVRSLGLTPIEERAEGMLVTVSPDQTLPTLVSKAESYISEQTESGNPRYGGVMAPIEKIRPAKREDKAGDRLAALLASDQLDPEASYWIDVELAGGEGEKGPQNRQQFADYVAQFQASSDLYDADAVTATSNFLVETDYSLHRVYLSGRAMMDLLDDSRANWILALDLVTQVESRSLALETGADGDLPPLPDLPPYAPRVVIIDAGIASEHPLFQDSVGRTIIGRQQNFLPSEDDTTASVTDNIKQGHGTAVASIVAYGSLAEIVRGGDAVLGPQVWIENAKIMAGEDVPQLHLSQFPKALMRKVVDAFHDPMPQQCKIFNLSAGTTPHPLYTMSNWAEELDQLAAAKDVLFVVSAGSLAPAQIKALLAEHGHYPDYLLATSARLQNPAQAYHALTVGAITPQLAAPTSPLRGENLLAVAHHPAPFTRNGQPHPGGLVKPDVVESGGNLAQQGSELQGTPESAILVANREYVSGEAEQPLTFQAGTGLAAAKVSHLAGLIQAQYPNARANLIRALIVNAAEWPATLVSDFANNGSEMLSKEDRSRLLRLVGYGVPQADKALSANSHCMVFVSEDKFNWVKSDKNSSGRYPAKVSFFSVKLEPDDIFRLPPATKVRVSLTLAYNPAVRKTQRRRYQAVDLRWDLKRREQSTEDFHTRWMQEVEGQEDENRDEVETARIKPWPWQLKPVLNPGGRVRRGSVIRDWFDVYIHDLPHTLELVVLGMVAPWRRPPESLTQNFALVVSIEALEGNVPIYDTVRVQKA